MNAARPWQTFGRLSLSNLHTRKRIWEEFIGAMDTLEQFGDSQDNRAYVNEQVEKLVRQLKRDLNANKRNLPHAPGYGDR